MMSIWHTAPRQETEETRLIDRFTKRETEHQRRRRIARKPLSPEVRQVVRRALGMLLPTA